MVSKGGFWVVSLWIAIAVRIPEGIDIGARLAVRIFRHNIFNCEAGHSSLCAPAASAARVVTASQETDEPYQDQTLQAAIYLLPL